jgi:hypothetical protein
MTGKILTGVISRRSRIAAVLASTVLAMFGSLAFAGSASATTLTCTNLAGATSGPLGCGGLQTAAGYTRGVLDIAPDGNYNNAVVRVQPDASIKTEDWTAFAVGGLTTGSEGGLGRYVAMFTPLGQIPSYTTGGVTYTNSVPAPGTTFTAGPDDYCISVTSEFNGPKHAARWNVVLRPCNTNGVFRYGTGGTTPSGTGSVTFGAANAYQEWAPINGEFGLELDNVWLRNHHNTEYTLNITGAGGAGTHLIAYPNSTPALNESWGLIGCTPPANTLSTGYVSCP